MLRKLLFYPYYLLVKLFVFEEPEKANRPWTTLVVTLAFMLVSLELWRTYDQPTAALVLFSLSYLVTGVLFLWNYGSKSYTHLNRSTNAYHTLRPEPLWMRTKW